MSQANDFILLWFIPCGDFQKAGVIRRKAKAVGSKIAAGAKAVGFWAKRGTQIAAGARLSARMMERAPAPARPGEVRITTTGSISRLHASNNEIEVNRGRRVVRYDAQGRRLKSTHVGRGDCVVTEKQYRAGALRPVRVEKRYQKR